MLSIYKKGDDKKALYPTKSMKQIKPIYELVKGRITFPLVPTIQATNKKTLDLSSGVWPLEPNGWLG